MNRALRMQGALFCAIAASGVGASMFLQRIPPRAELLGIAVLIVFLGVPHGALDTAFARQRFGLDTPRAWAGFVLGYGFVMVGVVLLWSVAPALFLAGFLVVSALHFSGDPVSGTPGILRLVQGGSVLVLPALRHDDELTRLFVMLVGPDAAGAVAPVMSAIALPWAVAVVVCAVMVWRRSPQTALELAAVASLACAAPPLLGFALFFCGMHSPRHMLRTATWARAAERRLVPGTVFVPMLGIALLGALAWHVGGDIPLEPKAIQLIFVGLASVTVPHMALVEPIRLNGWPDG